MGRIIVTLAGPWSRPPALDSRLLDLAFGPPSAAYVEEVASIGQRAAALSDEDLRRLRRHEGLVRASADFEGPGDLRRAKAAALLVRQAFAAGAHVAYLETAPKVLAPGALDGLETDDPAVLLHLFVEVLGDEQEIVAEGLQAFDLPDVVVPYATPEQADAAQAAAFALAARMVCDRFSPSLGTKFQASESAPVYLVAHREPPADADPDDPFVNPRGAFVLSRADARVEGTWAGS